MAHATHMAAMNAARKQFGKDWKESAYLEKVDGSWYVQVIQKEEPAPAVPALPAPLTAPASIPAAPALPMLPAFLAPAPQSVPTVPVAEPGMIADALPQDDLDVATLQAEADAQANAALTTELVLTHSDKCPGCGILLENGICDIDHLAEVQGYQKAYQMQKHEYSCMACGYEWGPLVGPNARKAPATTAGPRPRISTTENPTKKVWAIADSMPGAKRKEVIEACVKAGIAYGTARTQYQHWFKCIADQKVAPLAVIGSNGDITIINRDEVGK